MFVDTSAIVAILAKEPDADALVSRIRFAAGARTSPVVLLEAAMVLSSKLDQRPVDIQIEIDGLCAELGIKVSQLTPEHGRLAVQAYASYGKGRGHPAQLNLADCLSYACATSEAMPILCKGNDFARTDLTLA